MKGIVTKVEWERGLVEATQGQSWCVNSEGEIVVTDPGDAHRVFVAGLVSAEVTVALQGNMEVHAGDEVVINVLL